MTPDTSVAPSATATVPSPEPQPGSQPERRPAREPLPNRGQAPQTRAEARPATAARRGSGLAGLRRGLARGRGLLRELVWAACLLGALALLLGLTLVTVGANTDNALVAAVLRAAEWADLGVFSRTNGIRQFTGEGAAVRSAVVNWGLGAVAWLTVGRVARKLLGGSTR